MELAGFTIETLDETSINNSKNGRCMQGNRI